MTARSLAESFYRSFQNRDGEAMARAYAADARFSDPVFPALRGAEIGAMWQMLTSRSKDFRLTFDEVEAQGDVVTLRWVADYTFSKTGRAVTNVVRARLVFRDERIVSHDDAFSFWRWSRQALGPAGLLLGWTPFLQKKVQAEARKGLEAFLAK